MTDLDTARELLALEEKWLQPFDVRDPFHDLDLRGYLSQKPDHRYGALAITHVGGEPAPQRLLATPKLHYPFDRDGRVHFPPIRKIDIYEKLDGTNVLAYRYRDAGGVERTTYKLRLHPVLRNSRWGPFLDFWREILARYPAIHDLPERNACSVSFEMYGSRNAHLVVYDAPLDCAMLFGVSAEGECRPPSELETGGVPIPRHYGTLETGRDPVAEYGRIRAEMERGIERLEDEKLRGCEGTVWYVTPAQGSRLLFKCKPESVEAVHWAGGINKPAVEATCWNLLETQDTLTFDALLPLLLEEYTQEEIDGFRLYIDEVLRSVTEQLAFRNRVLAEYAALGLSIDSDKAGVMRTLSSRFARSEMKKVYSMIVRFGRPTSSPLRTGAA
ncbi:MAG: hypothetical protein HYY93_02695 [Planctomycetes bacterium]|nr:hypothetical protein [Planctomycetota bacterium]